MVYSATLRRQPASLQEAAVPCAQGLHRADADRAARRHAHVHPSMPVRTVKDLIALARARPGDITLRISRRRCLPASCDEPAHQHDQIKMVHVPYKGGGPAAIATSGGEVQVMLTPISEVLPTCSPAACDPSRYLRPNELPNIRTSPDRRHREGLRLHFVVWGTFVPAGTPKR